ncbi:predicted protein [Uncinocarpus reesii 1704]|uniref:Aminoglycoside phosphotransferase domain-containing protein n=1 Tax=Uncinocarpus reesii (strain UAMH 1704) TaxID=336963 RepID=C4JVK6_UNCRE|nr:uncharacterized protein UREG_06598 [Uncinocarpus reesii 1704]EEP81733.1 predicted protein [Uncinocarpus reesii 1704]
MQSSGQTSAKMKQPENLENSISQYLNQHSLSVPFNDLLSLLPSLLKEARYSEIWGIDLANGRRDHVHAILAKFLIKASVMPSLLVERTQWALLKTLKLRALVKPAKFAFSNAPQLAEFVYITRYQNLHVMWILLDEKKLKRYRHLVPRLNSQNQLMNIAQGFVETLVDILFKAASTFSELQAAVVIDCYPHQYEKGRKIEHGYRTVLRNGINDLIPRLVSGYPELLSRLFIINPCPNVFCTLPLPDHVLQCTWILGEPKEVAQHLGDEVPPRYGGRGKSLSENDCLADERSKGIIALGSNVSLQEPIPVGQAIAHSSEQWSSDLDTPEKEIKIPFSFSERIGFPTFILDPKDLETFPELYPGKGGARIVPIADGMLVKYGPGVRLAEAEALHLASTSTTIVTPQLIAAYILEDVCYIIMSYEEGAVLSDLWERTTQEQQDKIVSQLRDAVNQMRAIKGDYIGGIGHVACQDPIFDAGWAPQGCVYGPYESEEAFNEGIVKAMEDRFAPKPGEQASTSSIPVSEYLTRQTLRSLKGHEIVFAHGDLSPDNIIVRPDYTIVIVDWGLAGFWPEYWEYFRATVTIPITEDWDLVVEKFVPPYYIESTIMSNTAAVIWN